MQNIWKAIVLTNDGMINFAHNKKIQIMFFFLLRYGNILLKIINNKY